MLGALLALLLSNLSAADEPKCVDLVKLINAQSEKSSLSSDGWQTLSAILNPANESISPSIIKNWTKIDDCKISSERISAIPPPVSSTFHSIHGTMANENWLRAVAFIHELIDLNQLPSHQHIKKIQQILTYSLPRGWELGRGYRQFTEVDWGAGFFLQKDVESSMDVLIKGLVAGEGIEHPIRLAAVAWQGILTIHPFTDGNGRTALLVADWILVSHGYPPLQLSEQATIAMHRERLDPVHSEVVKLITDNILGQMH